MVNRNFLVATLAMLIVTSALTTFQFPAAPVSVSAQGPAPTVVGPVTPGILRTDLRTLTPTQAPTSCVPRPNDPRNSIPDCAPGGGAPSAASAVGSSVESSQGSDGHLLTPAVPQSSDPLSAPLVNFNGISFTGFVPADTNGAVGPNHYIQIVNPGRFAIFDKAGGLLAGPLNVNSLFTPLGLTDLCVTHNDGDPIVLYDHLANRWLISQFVFTSSPVRECIAISMTGDPVAGGYFAYDFDLSTVPNGIDYPKFGLWPDAYYMGTNGNYASGAAVAFDRVSMLAGSPATAQFFGTPADGAAPSRFMLPSDLKGPAPPAGAPNVFLRFIDDGEFGGVDRLQLVEFHVNFATPALSTFTALSDLATNAFDSNLCGFGFRIPCIAQPGTSQLLDTLRGEPMYPLVYRNFGTNERLIVSHDVKISGHAGIRWYELRKTAGAWSIFQQGDWSPDATNRWMGSMSMDKLGDIALGYSVSDGSSVFPGIRYTGRLQSDAAGVMTQGETTLMAGGGSQPTQTCGGGGNCGDRWGDYSAMQIDPADDCTFWYTTMYYPSSTSFNWRTRIGSFKFSECSRTTATVVTPNPSTVTLGNTITYTATVSDTSPGTPSTPTGSVSWNDGGAGGSFSSSGTCTLSAGSCQIVYRPSAIGSVTITAAYGGDPTPHLPSAGTSRLTVTYLTPQPVGGEIVPINTLRVLTPWVAVLSILGVVSVHTLVTRRRRKRTSTSR